MSRAAVALARLAVPSDAVTSDAQLLRAFIASRGEDAFAQLVRRHGPMVLAACRRVLGNTHDAEDAFQAAFLVFARKASTLRGANVAGWLYAVAVRTSRGVRVMRDRRKNRLLKVQKIGFRGEADPSPPPDLSLAVTEQAVIIDEELARLPNHYREAIILCELRGLSRKQAATELGIPEGTLSSRLVAAKRKLAERLSARGVAGIVALAATLAPVAVSAGLLQTTAAAVRGATGSVANAAASAVLKGMLFDQLKVAALTAGLLVTVVCGGLAMTGSPDAPPANRATPPAARPTNDPVAPLVKQLGSADFAEREAAEKDLRKLGPKAEPALRVGLKSEDPEVRARAAALLAVIRKDALDALVKGFDPKAYAEPDHPVWKRFKAIAGNTPASRELFAHIIKNAEWLRRLDAAEAGPEAAAHQYREAILDVGRNLWGNLKVSFFIPVWPCDTADQAAYLLLLGSYPGTEAAKPKDATDAQLFADGEGRIHFARGLGLGLQGKEVAPGPDKRYDATAALPAGSNRVFAKLLAAWLARRTDENVLYGGFDLAIKHRAPEVLPVARKVAADKERAAGARAALLVVAQFGDAADLPLFVPHFDDQTVVALSPPPTANSPGPRSRRLRVDDGAIALALLLCDQDPFEYGLAHAKDRFRRENGRPVIANYEAESFGFSDDAKRTAAHTKAKAFLNKQKDAPKPDPAVKLIEQLSSTDRAEREAAYDALRVMGLKAEPALKGALKSNDPDLRLRATNALDAIRRDAREALVKAFAPAKDVEPDHPVWKRFKTIAGNDRAARTLFAELISDPRRLRTLDDADRDPDKAGDLYASEVAAYYASVEALWQLRNTNPKAEERPWADEIAVLYLGTYPSSAGKIPEDANREGHLFRSWSEALDSPASLAVRQVFAAWLAHRDHPDTVRGALWRIGSNRIAEALSLLRKMVASEDTLPARRAEAALLIGILGTRGDVPLLLRLSDATKANEPFEKFEVILTGREELEALSRSQFKFGAKPVTPEEWEAARKKADIRACDRTPADCAWAAAVLLAGGKPEDLGFCWPRTALGEKIDTHWFYPLTTHGFPTTEARVAAHAKAKAFLDKQKP